jgi:hypothetical protein
MQKHNNILMSSDCLLTSQESVAISAKEHGGEGESHLEDVAMATFLLNPHPQLQLPVHVLLEQLLIKR